MNEAMGKITKSHLSKKAVLYIRQSTMRQVYENTESTIRQYALREKLVSLGWDKGDVLVIDKDLGCSGSNAGDRDGFQQLVGEVSNGMAGAVACIECSRLSRSSNDWGRLTEYCAMTDTLLIDADGIYNPNDFNDRLLLGLKGTMSEAELHFLKQRMRGGLLNKAKRGELKKPLPIGYLYDDSGAVVKDTAADVRHALELFFESFRAVGTAWGMLGYYKERGYKFPHRVNNGFRKGEVVWADLVHSRVLGILHNPTYAGAYHYGESQKVWTPEGFKIRQMPKEDWIVLIRDHHEAYIAYEEYEHNEERLLANAHPRGGPGKKTPPREGPALLQGLAVCGKCGTRMTVRYKKDMAGKEMPYYICQKNNAGYGAPACQSIKGLSIDEGVSAVLLERLSPLAVQSTIGVQKELARRKGESALYYQMRVEKGRYEAELARRRYLQVDPDNRLVALELESAWNIRLKELEEAQGEYERKIKGLEGESPGDIGVKLGTVAESFGELWKSPEVGIKDKKRMIRYLVEDVTLVKKEEITQVHIRFKGGTTESIALENPRPSCQIWATGKEALDVIRKEAGRHTASEIAGILNSGGMKSGKGQEFNPRIIHRLMKDYNIPTLRERYEGLGYIAGDEKAGQLNISKSALMKRVRNGSYNGTAVKVTDKNEYLFKE